ncbi:MAG: RlmE family RNA methyltransferase [Thiobacillaceae bacterium]|nr:RlmE family RNA methyltransferase [Thiobacillaceae bacterium]MDW8324382.1 RlmE family RNA methyltransferase [Burkholderiales bacterium]
MKRQAKTRTWFDRHVHDPYVRLATARGYRSRAAFKLMELDARDRLLRPGLTVVDLGCAPGGWCQVALERLQGRGRVIGIDLLPMEPLPGVDFIQGDFGAATVQARLRELLADVPVDLVLCDAAPNLSGVAAADQARIYDLARQALAFACVHLQPAGAFVVKVFQGEDFDAFVGQLRTAFARVLVRKPQASRERSREVYLLARELRQN